MTEHAGHGALATVEGKQLAIGNGRLLEREGIELDGLMSRALELAGEGRTVLQVAIDGKASALIAIADAPRDTARAAVEALEPQHIRPVMLTGDNRQTATRIGRQLGIKKVIAEVLRRGRLIQSIPVGAGPHGIAASGDP